MITKSIEDVENYLTNLVSFMRPAEARVRGVYPGRKQLRAGCAAVQGRRLLVVGHVAGRKK